MSQAGPLDWAIDRLRWHDCPVWPVLERGDQWTSVCPLCRCALTLREHGDPLDAPLPCSITCSARCPEDAIKTRLRAEPADARVAEALELAAQHRDEAARALQYRDVAVRALQIAGAVEAENVTLRKVIDRGLAPEHDLKEAA